MIDNKAINCISTVKNKLIDEFKLIIQIGQGNTQHIKSISDCIIQFGNDFVEEILKILAEYFLNKYSSVFGNDTFKFGIVILTNRIL